MSSEGFRIPPRVMSRLIERTSKDPTWLAFWFAIWQESNAARLSALRKRLSVNERGLRFLFLSGAPRDEHFPQDISRLALAAGANRDALAALVREARFIHESRSGSRRRYEAALMAARDVKPPKRNGSARGRSRRDR